MPSRCLVVLAALGLWLVGPACSPNATAVGDPNASTGTSDGLGTGSGPTSGSDSTAGTMPDGSGSEDASSGTTAPEGDWAEGWGFRKRIRIHPGVDLSEFPVVLLFDEDPDLTANTADDGSDLMVTDQGGLDVLPFELELYSAGTGALWVDAGPLSATEETVVYLYYGNPEPPAPPPAADTWPARFEGVWHMTLDGTDLPDSVSPPHPASATSEATTAELRRGIIGATAFFDGVDDTHSAGDPQDGSLDAGMDSFTVSLWTLVDASTGMYDTPLYKGAAEDNDPGYGFFFGSTNWVGCISDAANMRQHLLLLPAGPADQVWHHHLLTVDRDRGMVTAYLDGAMTTTEALEAGDLDSQDVLTFSNPASPFSGLLDEVRVQRSAVDAGWAAAEWRNVTDPSGFYTVEAEQAAP